MGSTVLMVYNLYHIIDQHSTAAYMKKITKKGPSYRARQRQRIQCPGCASVLEAGLLGVHRKTQHGISCIVF